MPNILTPASLWNNFDKSADTLPEVESTTQNNEIFYDRITFSGRNTEQGRVKIAAMFAYSQPMSQEAVLILPDSNKTVDSQMLEFFVSRGYSALMVDYRGEWENSDFFTKYPEDISYANTAKCGRTKDYVDDSADKTCWYEWVAVGLFAIKYLRERVQSDKIAVVGIRDGGEIAWKLAFADNLKCIVPVNAVGWKAYANISKYSNEDLVLNEERYRFIAGIDSQAYAPNIKCPVLMLCSLYDDSFDYDRAFDTFSRINTAYLSESSIAYSIRSGMGIDSFGVDDMFLFLGKNLKNRQVFIPKPPVISVDVDEDSNLIAKIKCDTLGIVESCTTFFAEDNIDFSLREWDLCPVKGFASTESAAYLNVYEKTGAIFVLSRAKYTNGFTVWSKTAVKKLSGRFRNNACKCKVLYNDKVDASGIFVAKNDGGISGVFYPEALELPQLVTKAFGVNGLYSEHGLSTLRMNSPKYQPNENNMLSVDAFCDVSIDLTFIIKDMSTGEEYFNILSVVGGVWQNLILQSTDFKTVNGATLDNFTGAYKFSITCPIGFAVNNIMWL